MKISDMISLGGGKQIFSLAGEERFWLGNGIFGFCLGGNSDFWPKINFFRHYLKNFAPAAGLIEYCYTNVMSFHV